jgi:hypothetical protein
MKPSMDHLLISMATTVGLKIIPEMPETSYALGDAKMVAALSILLAQEVDRAADVLVQENTAIRALFAAAAGEPVVGLATPLAEAAKSVDANIRVSTLEMGNAVLKALLIQLHELVEANDAAWAKRLNEEIWAILKSGAQARMLVLPSM